MCNALKLLSATNSPSKSDEEWVPAEMVSYLSCTTLDIIGMAGFNYSFGSLKTLVNNTTKKTSATAVKGETSQNKDPLASALSRTLDATTTGFPILQLLKTHLPIFRLITFDRRTRTNNKSRAIIHEIGKQIVSERKRAIAEEKNGGMDQTGGSKDLLTLLIKANLADNGTDQRLTDEEVMNQIPTFFLAGHETTSTSTAWALFSLACDPAIQSKLRAELLEVPTDYPKMEQLNSLSYLDMVIRETLRYHSVVNEAVRVAVQDDVIPFEKPFEDSVAKGDGIFIPIRVLNTLPEIWGPDAEEFNPDRWINPPKEASSIPNAWDVDLIPQADCVSMNRMKALLFALIRNFEFKLNVPLEELIQKTSRQVSAKSRKPTANAHQANQVEILVERASWCMGLMTCHVQRPRMPIRAGFVS
ncbi:12913_t:CDS:2 [Acaulospora colombiana]|uniref:12913_t:CDS:1 n=1 Tax=Acaulospora colombiana TaxID=27376 RepID=A0ACA9L7J0_9GLOM|nr:12913_t:CDS:2 [Acaulospora colombiana]